MSSSPRVRLSFIEGFLPLAQERGIGIVAMKRARPFARELSYFKRP